MNSPSPKRVIAFASYKEAKNLSVILKELAPNLSSKDLILICDDSGPTHRKDIVDAVEESLAESHASIRFSFNEVKSGRGLAIRNGLMKAILEFPELTQFVESDSDGSHRPPDILKVLEEGRVLDFVIGSRYLNESSIDGWTFARKLNSKILNSIIPLLLGIRTSDVTNGLRSYSRKSIDILLSSRIVNPGFIYLSEQALILKQYGIQPRDVPIEFANRNFGQSSVGFRELWASLEGIVKLVVVRRKHL
jgi:dolichol-phosphate mannosyltransferase